MANLAILTKKISRDKLARAFNSHEAIKMMEDLTQDVGQTLAGASDANAADIAIATDSALLAQASATSAKNSAAIAESVAREAMALLQTMRTQASEISALRSELAEVRAITQGTRSWL